MKPFTAAFLPANSTFSTLASPFIRTVTNTLQLKIVFAKAQKPPEICGPIAIGTVLDNDTKSLYK